MTNYLYDERADTIEKRRRKVEDALYALFTKRNEITLLDFEYDVDTRWDQVSAFATFTRKGQRYRVTIEPEQD